MRSHTRAAVVLAAASSVFLLACGDVSAPLSPRSTTSLAGEVVGGSDRIVNMMDACEPTTFNAALRDPTACVRNGGVTFQKFLAQLQKHGEIGAWRFSPPNMNVQVGQTLLAVNRGGEVHTFTEVEEFGGGIVPSLNQLSHNPDVAEECEQLDADDFVRPGETYREEVEDEGTELYQCCIHPWMRTVVHAREH